jgi:hypothetical protein
MPDILIHIRLLSIPAWKLKFPYQDIKIHHRYISPQMIASNLAKESILVYKASCPCYNGQLKRRNGQA